MNDREAVMYGIEYLRGWAESPVTDDETRGNLREWIAAIQKLVERTDRDDGHRVPNLDDLATLLQTVPSWVEDGDSTWSSSGVDTQAIGNALDWSCYTCRDDVGWVDHAWFEAKGDPVNGMFPPDVIALIECGHCGGTNAFDARTGDDVEDDVMRG